MWLGFEHGLFKTKEGETCLDDKTAKNLYKVIATFENRDFSKIQTLIPAVMEIVENLKSCPTITEVKEIELYCQEDPTRCDSTMIIGNIQKGMFAMMGKLTDMSSIISELPSETADELYTNMYQVGDDLGSVFRTVLGLDVKEKNEEKKQKDEEKKQKDEEKKQKDEEKKHKDDGKKPPKDDKKKPNGPKFL